MNENIKKLHGNGNKLCEKHNCWYYIKCPECQPAPKYKVECDRTKKIRIKSIAATSQIGNTPRVIDVYNPKYNPTYIGVVIRKHIDNSCKPDKKVPYGGLSDFSGDGYDQRPKSLGHFDKNGNQIRCTPKQQGMQKNKCAKQKTKYLVRYVESNDSYKPVSRKTNDVSFPEWDIILLKEAYQYVDENNIERFNPIWKPYLRPTKTERDIQKQHPGHLRPDELTFLSSLH